MKLTIIAAMDPNRLIGRGHGLPWRLPADLKHFKTQTMGHSMIMGRRTWETLAGSLAGRTNVVVTHQPDYRAENAKVAQSLEEALNLVSEEDEVFIAGGAEIYRQMLDRSDRMVLTLIHHAFEGDTWFPEWDPALWRLVSREDHEPDEKNQWPWSFLVYERLNFHDA